MEGEKTLEQLQQENADLSAKVSELETELDATKQVNDGLTAKIEELSSSKTLGEAGEKAQSQPKPVLPTDSFEVNGAKYKFIAPVFVYGGKRIEAQKAINDTDLLSELVSKGIGVIVKA